MALLFIDGFDHGGNGVQITNTGHGKWGVGTGTLPLTSNVVSRTGGFALRVQSSGTVTTKVFPASGGVALGVAIQVTAPFAADLVQVLEGATVHLAIAFTAGGLLTVKRGSTVLATSTTVIVANTWYYLELLATIHDTAGSYTVRIDGVAEAALTASGIDTRNVGTTGQWDRILLAGVLGQSIYYDDFYLCDTSGAAPHNTFLGAVKIETLYPQTDVVAAGSNAGLTPSTGTDHGALVDETPPNTTDYNSSATVGAKDTYNYPALTLTGTIAGLQTNLYCQKSDALAKTICAVIRVGGTDFDGANLSPLTTFSYLSEVRALNPATSGLWTAAAIAAMEAGMKVTA